MRERCGTGVQACAFQSSLGGEVRIPPSDSQRQSLPVTESGVRLARLGIARRDSHFSAQGCCLGARSPGHLDRKSVVEGKSVDLGGRRIIKKNRIRDNMWA